MLLKSALDPPERALRAWNAWSEQFDPDLLSFDEQRLLPLVWTNLKAFSIPKSDFLSRTYRHSWSSGRIQRGRCGTVLEAFNRLGIEPLLSKGMGLVESCYGEPALRPMGDLDLLLRHRDLDLAFRSLDRLGLEVGSEETHAFSTVHSSGLKVDLHRYALKENRWLDADEGLWSRSRPVALAGGRGRIPCPEDLLLIVSVHGLRSSSSPWVADAAWLLKKRLDWSLLVEETKARRVVVQMKAALDVLLDFGLPLEEPALERLRSTPVALLERLLLAGRARGVRLSGLAYDLLCLLRAGVFREAGAFLRQRLRRWKNQTGIQRNQKAAANPAMTRAPEHSASITRK